MKKFCIIIPFHNPESWHTDYANQTARQLSNNHTVICYLWGDAVSIREIVVDKKRYIPITKRGNTWKYHPLFFIPGKRIVSIQYINMFFNVIAVSILWCCLSFFQKRTRIFWFFGIFDPVFLLLPHFFRYSKTVYDCVDAPSHPNKRMEKLLKQSERDILAHAWIVTANSRSMQSRLTRIRRDVHLVPLGFREEMFRHPASYSTPQFGSKPVVGYIGAIDYRINLPLLEYLAARHRHWQFFIIGPIFNDHLRPDAQARMRTFLNKPNVYHAEVPNKYIPNILSSFDAAIIPYTSGGDFNRYAFPMKTMEYLYAQKRIVASAEIRELHFYAPLILFASHQRDWERHITYAIAHPLTIQESQQAKNIAKLHTWRRKIQTQLSIMEKTDFD